MRWTVVIGSHRQQSNSQKIADYIGHYVGNSLPEISLNQLKMSDYPMPFWHQDAWDKDSQLSAQFRPISEQLSQSHGYIVLVPEWAGMAPAGLKNLFLYTSKHELAHKPAFIIGVSSGTGGAYPCAELRMSSHKNTRVCYIPEQMVMRQANDLFNDFATPATSQEAEVRARLHYNLKILKGYTSALNSLREQTEFNFKDFPHGQ